ncbi:hypothetical protein EJ08DRAFT_49770 [Tothia fuscella]|uniref:Uncharacterized protein n=1 Tax=Tothia fuscella TaxID=1048955 RepID=A0A9P4NFC1_9PEZI|nr:hypothetical protein EJ08DRAFT_49770 [Tothia fuscella]
MQQPQQAQQAQPIWDPISVLKMKNTDPIESRITCIGQTKKLRRCGLWISAKDLSSANSILQTLSRQNPSFADMRVQLRRLARLLLDKRYHYRKTTQINAKLREWEESIHGFQASRNVRRGQGEGIHVKVTKPDGTNVEIDVSL